MLYVAKSDGKVLRFDLSDREDLRGWLVLSSEVSFHASIRSISLGNNGNRVDLPLPKRFRDVRYEIDLIQNGDELVAEVVSAVLDGVVVTLTMYLNGASGRFRVDVDKRGRRRFNPQTIQS